MIGQKQSRRCLSLSSCRSPNMVLRQSDQRYTRSSLHHTPLHHTAAFTLFFYRGTTHPLNHATCGQSSHLSIIVEGGFDNLGPVQAEFFLIKCWKFDITFQIQGSNQGWVGIPVSRDSREYKPQISLPFPWHLRFPFRSRGKEILAGN